MLRLTANAKINWSLDVLGARPDGYHLLDMLMESVTVSDTLTLENANELTLFGSPLGADFARDLTYRAALLLKEHSGYPGGASMTLIKRVPSGAGMGGGSADAAAALIGLNRLWGLHTPLEELLSLGLRLGADVPFALTGGLCRVGGVGERITRLNSGATRWLAIVQPCEGLSTKEVYALYDSLGAPPEARPDNDACEGALLAGDDASLARAMSNALAPASQSLRPEIKEAEALLTGAGALRAMMTGSGSAVYGLFADEKAAKSARDQLRGRYERIFVAHTARQGVTIEEM